MESSFEWQIKLIEDWQFFATLTWNPHLDLGTVCKRRNHVTYWLREIARHGNTSEKRLCYVIRWESGELGGLPHCHILIAETTFRHFPSACFVLKNTWKKGISQVRLYDPGKVIGMAAYMSKGRFSAAWAQGANNYEVAKFGKVGRENMDSIYISKRAQERMQQRRSDANDRSFSLQTA
jgi:hypothetical protein